HVLDFRAHGLKFLEELFLNHFTRAVPRSWVRPPTRDHLVMFVYRYHLIFRINIRISRFQNLINIESVIVPGTDVDFDVAALQALFRDANPSFDSISHYFRE